MTATPPGEASYQQVRATESRLEFALAGIMSLLVIGTLYYVYVLFEPLAPEGRLRLWAGFTLFVSLVMGSVPLLFFWLRPSDAAVMRFWSPLGKVVAVLFDLAVASSVWLLLTYASEPLRLLMVVFYSAAISGQVISTAESTATIVFGVVAIFGSAALFFLVNGTLYAVPLGLFLLAFGGMMVVVALILKKAIRTAIMLRVKAEQITAELEVALGQAQAEREARTRFIAAVSHDLRQPLQAASLFAHNAASIAGAHGEAVDGVRRALAEAGGLLENMSQHLRIESGAITPQLQTVPMADLIAGLAQELTALAARAGIDLRCHGADNAIALADPALTARILRNLVHNAISHARAARIRVFARQRAMTEICVIDDGIGIDLTRSETYLAAYSQGPASRREGPGSGLGLAIARDLAQLMGGDIALLPGPGGRGLHVRLSLPRAPDAVRPAAAAPEAPQSLLAGQSLLVIDDHPDALAAALEWCRLQGAAAVRGAPSEADALALVAQGYRPDLVLTDWHLGAPSDSAALIAALRRAAPAAGIIVMTGDARPATRDEIAALVVPMVLKPMDARKLARALDRLKASARA